MLLPHMRDDEVHHTPRFEDPLKFLNDTSGLGRGYQQDNRGHVIEGSVWKWQLREPANHVERGIIPRRIALAEVDTHIFSMCEERFETTLACTCIKHSFAGWD